MHTRPTHNPASVKHSLFSSVILQRENCHELQSQTRLDQVAAPFHVHCCWSRFHMAHKCEIGEQITCECCDVPAAGPSLQVNTDKTWLIMWAVSQLIHLSRQIPGKKLYLLIKIYYKCLYSVISTFSTWFIFILHSSCTSIQIRQQQTASFHCCHRWSLMMRTHVHEKIKLIVLKMLNSLTYNWGLSLAWPICSSQLSDQGTNTTPHCPLSIHLVWPIGWGGEGSRSIALTASPVLLCSLIRSTLLNSLCICL